MVLLPNACFIIPTTTEPTFDLGRRSAGESRREPLGVAKTRVRDRIGRRREILLAAGRVFIKKGFRLATMEDIAAAAGLGVGTLYHYFDSKEQLFASLLAEVVVQRD